MLNHRIRLSMVTALACTATAAIASPQETFTQGAQITGTFQSNGLANGATNGVATFTAVGGYTLRHIKVSGTWTENPANTITFPKEACFLVTPPSGQPFIMEPLLDTVGTTLSIPAAYFAVPLAGTGDPAGVWTIRLFELYDDGGATYDADWSGLSIVFDDADPPITGAYPGAVASATFSDVPSDLLTGTSVETRTYVHAGAEVVNGYAISGLAEAVTGYTANNTVSPVSDVRIGVTPPGGTEVVFAPFANPCFSPQDGFILGGLPAPMAATGTWTLRFFESADTAGGVDNIWKTVTLSLISATPPTAVTLDPESDPGNFVSAIQTVAAPGEIKWFTFTLSSGVTTALGQSLDIDTEGSVVTDCSIGLYNAGGSRLVTDFDDGSDLQAQISYGAGLRSPFGNSVFYNGRDGGSLPAGTYYVAVAADNTATFQPSLWGVTNTAGVNTGDVKCRVRYYPSNSPVEGPVVDATLNPESTPGAWVETDVTLNTGTVTWVRINVPSGALTADTRALDIDCQGTSIGPANDTNIGLYRSTGALVDSDTADGTDLLPQLTYGTGLRFPPGNGLPFNGVDGAADITGDSYYLAINGGGGAFGATFGATNTGANSGTVHVRVRWISPATFENPPFVATLSPEATPGAFVSADVALSSGAVTWVKVEVPSGALAADTRALDLDCEGTSIGPANDTNIGLYRSTGALVDSDTLDGTDALPQLTYGTGVRFPATNGQPYNGRDGAADITAGTYYLAINGGGGAFGAGFGATNTGANSGTVRVRARWVSPASTETPTVAATLQPETNPGVFVFADVPVSAGGAAWVKIEVPSGALAASTAALDIDCEGTTAFLPGNNPVMSLYRTTGVLLDTDDNDGSDSLPQLSYGSGRRNPPGNGLAYDGRDGAADITAGDYYLVVYSNTADAGTVRVRARWYGSNAPVEAPIVVQDLGAIGGPSDTSLTVDITELNVLRWYTFTINNEVSDTSGFYLDIDTTQLGAAVLDTEIGVYRNDGTANATWADDDDGFPAGVGFSALSFGQTAPVRDYSAIGTGGQVDGNGRDGILPAGTYYIVVGRYNVNFGLTNWSAVSTATLAGEPVKLNFRTNLPPVGPVACSPADLVDGLGSPPGDGFVTGTDADFFVMAYNTLLQRPNGSYYADLTDGFGGGPDGFVTGTDADYFTEKYFLGC